MNPIVECCGTHSQGRHKDTVWKSLSPLQTPSLSDRTLTRPGQAMPQPTSQPLFWKICPLSSCRQRPHTAQQPCRPRFSSTTAGSQWGAMGLDYTRLDLRRKTSCCCHFVLFYDSGMRSRLMLPTWLHVNNPNKNVGSNCFLIMGIITNTRALVPAPNIIIKIHGVFSYSIFVYGP